jgi:hypothetical protein
MGLFLMVVLAASLLGAGFTAVAFWRVSMPADASASESAGRSKLFQAPRQQS